MNMPLLEVTGLKKHFGAPGSAAVKAVDDVSFSIAEGQTLGLVGESGCGKSTTGRSVLRLIEPSAGSVRFMGRELTILPAGQLRAMRRHMQMVFQDPYASLNPRMTIGEVLEEPLIVHKLHDRATRRRLVAEALDMVGLNPSYAARHPHEFSGGQRQRVGIARAIITRPKLVVADEAVSALDVSIQAQILNLLKDLQKELGLTYLFVSHDLAVIRHVSDTIGVMYLGRMVELGTREEIYANPRHPYTQALLSAIPREHPGQKRERIVLQGSIPNPAAPPAGCHFHPRCPSCMEVCKTAAPTPVKVSAGQTVACHLYR
ncbi:ABC transporter ATP-binding protein [Herbaspirillum robiniae]|uniref:ATP-binding cassette domain-containing protein n=1 Tax=Herbaspirillum robiniae TaxID=2014887 RepID=A0A246WVQ4_9BURK|nr:oligopeptide/dipeptide ABC transporter ATP-binding protein [Herbaspirillum robiniae]NUU00737.1 ATP-binding cassette domain-containing protein [Herbaspirillum robiniae]OWY31123.1 peptide ABC transporter ATP-binding protein [Herbaspirillum robiniae]